MLCTRACSVWSQERVTDGCLNSQQEGTEFNARVMKSGRTPSLVLLLNELYSEFTPAASGQILENTVNEQESCQTVSRTRSCVQVGVPKFFWRP